MLRHCAKGPLFFEKYFSAVTAKGAKKHVSNGAVAVNLPDDADLSKFFAANTEKEKMVVLIGPADSARINYGLADKVYKAGYKKTALFNGNSNDIQ